MSGPRLPLRVTVLTTSYPTPEAPTAGAFVRGGVGALRELGVEVNVISPATFSHFGVALGEGIAGNLRRHRWRLFLVPAFLVAFVRAARFGTKRANVVHAHWLVSAIPAFATGKPVVLQPWGTDIVLAARARPLARVLLRRAAVVVTASEALAGAARLLGARDVRVIPSGVEIPADVPAPESPPHVLFAGRLSEEKGIAQRSQTPKRLASRWDEPPTAASRVWWCKRFANERCDTDRHRTPRTGICAPPPPDGTVLGDRGRYGTT